VPPFRFLAASAIVAGVVAGALAPDALASPPSSDPIYAVASNGHPIASGGHLHPGESVQVYARGFAPRASVQVVDAVRRHSDYVVADAEGRAHVTFVAPTSLPSDRLPLVALAGPIPTAKPSTSGGNASVTVPLLRRFDYRLSGSPRGRDGVDAGSVALGSGVHRVRTDQAPAATGFDVVTWMLIAIALSAAGTAMQLVSRRRA
jgi:hypothetical protein